MNVAVPGVTLGELLRRVRDRRGARLRNCDLARRLSVSEATLGRLLSDELPGLELRTATRVAELLDVPLAEVARAHAAGLDLKGLGAIEEEPHGGRNGAGE